MKRLTSKVVEGGCVLGGHKSLYEPPDQPHRDRDLIDPELRIKIQGLANGTRPWPLVLLGEAGSGKTCAALCMLDAFGGWYKTLADLCDLLIRAQKGELTWYSGHRRFIVDIWDDWRRAHLVVLDEIGARENVSDHHYETIKRAMDFREGRPAVYISNHVELSELGRLYGDPISSRLGAEKATRAWLKGDRRVGGRDC